MKSFLVFFFFFSFYICNENIINTKNSVFDMIKKTNGFIFSQMRGLKSNFHHSIQHEFEKIIKQYESKYLINKEEFIDFIWDKFHEMKYYEENSDSNFEDAYRNEIYEVLKEFIQFYKLLNKNDKNKVDLLIEEQDNYTKEIFINAKSNHHIFNDEAFGDLTNIVEKLPHFLKNDDKNIDSIDYENNSQFKIKKVNPDFKNFLNMMNEEYKLNEINSAKSHKERKEKIGEIIQKITPKHKSWFSSFLEEYIQEAVFNDDDFKTNYTLNKMQEIDLSAVEERNRIERIKQNNLMKQPLNGPFRFKNLNNEMSKMRTDVKALKSAGMQAGVISENEAEREADALAQKVELSGSCSEREEKLNKEIAKKLEWQKGIKDKSTEDLKEVPSENVKEAGKKSAASKITGKMLSKFTSKIASLIGKHMPFYFFKMCMPPGPLVFGCCPEAAFLPQQMYNVFTALEKVDKIKVKAKGFQDWLGSIGREITKEVEYYACAQSYLTVHESATFNICNLKSLILMNPLNLQGKIPGDLPLCFTACIQALALCKCKLKDLGPCDALINPQTVIKAMSEIPLRLRLAMAFGSTCTYIPFLVRWDLVPKWTGTEEDIIGSHNRGIVDNQSDQKGEEGNKEESNCADDDNLGKDKPKEVAISAFEKELINISQEEQTLSGEQSKEVVNSPLDAYNFLNSVRNDPSTSISPPQELNDSLISPRGAPVKKSKDRIKTIDIDADMKLGHKVADADMDVDVFSNKFSNSPIPSEIMYHISTYRKDTSEEKEKMFPFHTKRILVNDN